MHHGNVEFPGALPDGLGPDFITVEYEETVPFPGGPLARRGFAENLLKSPGGMLPDIVLHAAQSFANRGILPPWLCTPANMPQGCGGQFFGRPWSGRNHVHDHTAGEHACKRICYAYFTFSPAG